MKRVSYYLTVLWIVLLITLFIVPVAFAQDGGTDPSASLLAPFAPILAATVAVERILQFIRNIISPDPENGPLKRGPNLQKFTTYGSIMLGLIFAFMSGGTLQILALADIKTYPLLDTIVTGVVIGMGTEFVHEFIKVLAEGKDALRKTANS